VAEGVSVNMMNRKSIRVLITLVLATAILTAFGTEARAAMKGTRPFTAVTIGSQAPKPGTSPMSGEPDYPNGSPLPLKAAASPTGGGVSNWALRVQWLVRTWLGNVPRRFL
jgi:hypothetical protein